MILTMETISIVLFVIGAAVCFVPLAVSKPTKLMTALVIVFGPGLLIPSFILAVLSRG